MHLSSGALENGVGAVLKPGAAVARAPLGALGANAGSAATEARALFAAAKIRAALVAADTDGDVESFTPSLLHAAAVSISARDVGLGGGQPSKRRARTQATAAATYGAFPESRALAAAAEAGAVTGGIRATAFDFTAAKLGHVTPASAATAPAPAPARRLSLDLGLGFGANTQTDSALLMELWHDDADTRDAWNANSFAEDQSSASLSTRMLF